VLHQGPHGHVDHVYALLRDAREIAGGQGLDQLAALLFEDAGTQGDVRGDGHRRHRRHREAQLLMERSDIVI
jgi:hypothetical protein